MKKKVFREKHKRGWAVTQENDGKVHVRPTVNKKIIDTPIIKVIKPRKKKSDK